MSTYTIRPDETIWGASYFAITGGSASVSAALSDSSDSTYIRMSSQQSGDLALGLPDPSVPATEFPDRLYVQPRIKGSSGFYTGFGVDTTDDGGSSPNLSGAYSAVLAMVLHNHSSITDVPRLMSRKWTNDMVTKLRVGFHSFEPYDDAARAYYYELPVLIWTQKYASATVANLSETATVYPKLTATVTADIDTWQLDYSIARTMQVALRIESGGTGAGTGTLIASTTAAAVFDATAGTGRTLDVDITSPVALENGTYNVYASVGRQRTQYAGEWLYGDWSSAATLTQNVPLPTAPTLSVTADDTNDRASVSVTPVATTGYSDPTFSVERSVDAGTTWEAVRGMTDVAGTFGSATVLYDYEGDRGVAVKYRARVTATYTGGIVNTGPWTTTTTGVTIAADGWNLKCPEDPALNIIGAEVIGDVGESQFEEMGVFHAVGRTYPTVVAGTLSGFDGAITVLTDGETEYAALKAIRAEQAVLLLQSPYGWQKYVRVTGAMDSVIVGPVALPLRETTVSYVETAAP